MRSAATDTPTTHDNRDVRRGLGHHTFETVQGSLSWRYLEVGRPASKAGPTLVRGQLQPMAQPGLLRFCAGTAYRTRRQTVRCGDPVRASATPPRVHEARRAHTPVTVGTPIIFDFRSVEQSSRAFLVKEPIVSDCGEHGFGETTSFRHVQCPLRLRRGFSYLRRRYIICTARR